MRKVQRPKLQPAKQMKDSGKEFFVAKKKCDKLSDGAKCKKKEKVIYHSVGYSGDELAIIHRN